MGKGENTCTHMHEEDDATRRPDYRSQNCSLHDGCILVLEWTFHFANMITRTHASRIADSF